MQGTTAIFKTGTWTGGSFYWDLVRTLITPDGLNIKTILDLL